MKEDSVTIGQIAECIRAAADTFAPRGETPRTWRKAVSSTWLACPHQQWARYQVQPCFACTRCGRQQLYSPKPYCEQCSQRMRVMQRRILRRNHRSDKYK